MWISALLTLHQDFISGRQNIQNVAERYQRTLKQMEKYSMFMNMRSNIKMSGLPKLIYWFNLIAVKISKTFPFYKSTNWFWNSNGDVKDSEWPNNRVGELTLADFNTSTLCVGTKTDKSIAKKRESLSRITWIYTTDLQQRSKGNSGQKRLLNKSSWTFQLKRLIFSTNLI